MPDAVTVCGPQLQCSQCAGRMLVTVLGYRVLEAAQVRSMSLMNEAGYTRADKPGDRRTR